MQIKIISGPLALEWLYAITYKIDEEEKQLTFFADQWRMAEVLKQTGWINHYIISEVTKISIPIVTEVGDDIDQIVPMLEFVEQWTDEMWRYFIERYEGNKKCLLEGHAKAHKTTEELREMLESLKAPIC